MIYLFTPSFQHIPSQAEAIELVKDAILAGIFNDLGSGSNVDLTIIRKTGEVSVLRGYVTPNDEHNGHGDAIRAARTDGMRIADEQRRAWHRSQR